MRTLSGILIITIALFLTCCGNKNKQNTNQVENGKDSLDSNVDTASAAKFYKPSYVIIKGYIKGGANANVILDELDIGQINPLVSKIVDERGGFMFDFEIPEPGIYQLRFPNSNIHLFLRGGQVQINTDISDVGSYEIIGSPESYHLKEMYTILSEINHKTSSLQDRVEDLKKDKSKVKQLLALVDSLPIYYDAISMEKASRLKKFIDRIDTSMVGLLAAFYLDADENYDYVVSTRNRFSKICPHSRFYKQLDKKVNEIIPVGPGKMAPNTIADDASGKTISLSSYLGKNVLIYFWASYCELCREENVIIKKVHNEFKNTGFTVYAISLDEQKTPWIQAIKEDNLDWVNLCNLLGWEDELSHIYRVDDLPYLILVDKEGKITARGFRAHELKTKLKAIMH